MGWLQLEADLGDRPPAEVEPLLEAAGAVTISLRDGGDNPLLEPAPGETPVWPTVILTALFPAAISEAELRARLADVLTSNSLSFTHIDEQDWEKNFRQTLRAERFGRRLWVVPDALTKLPADAVSIQLSPGLAFGTGSHPTTAMCLEWLDSLDLADQQVLDYGCGSGILGLSAAALGAASVTMTDIDPQAISASTNNATVNQLTDRVRIKLPAEIEEPVHHDVLVANILSGTLIELGPQLNGFMRPGALLAITGILADQANEVIDAWSGWADIAVRAQTREWVLLTGSKHATADSNETTV